MRIDDVHQGIKKHRKRRRVGRGPGSGHGKTSGRGHKGQQSRAGSSALATFQGGAMPLVRRVPKRGFFNKFADTTAIINLKDLEVNFETGEEVTPETLKAKAVVKGRYDRLKILGDGSLSKKLKVSAHGFSKSAAEGITSAGGEVVVLQGKTPVREKQKRSSGNK